MKKRLQHLQATSLMRDFDDVNFAVTVAGILFFSFWVSPEQYCDDLTAKIMIT